MNKTTLREALEQALLKNPHGKTSTYIRRSIARNHGYQRAYGSRRPRVPQVWSSSRAAKEFFGG